LNVLDLFSGIGGFSIGLEKAGMHTVAFCEIESYCRTVLRKHWPDVPIFDDIRTLTRTDVAEPIDLVCGGWPCQPWSVAGRQRGDQDDRDLWPEVRRIVEAFRPKWLLGKNVSGFVSNPMGLDRCFSDLEVLGYAARPFVIPAVAVDAPHRRDRVWIVAHTSISGPQGPCQQQDQRGAWPDSGGQFRGGSAWLPEPNVGRVANGIPNRVDRLKALGNAVVPQIPEIIGRAIMAAEHDQT